MKLVAARDSKSRSITEKEFERRDAMRLIKRIIATNNIAYFCSFFTSCIDAN